MMTKRVYIIVAFLLPALLLLSSCFRSGHGAGHVLDTQDSVITAAKLLSMQRTADYTLVTIADPWRGGVLHRYVLVPRDTDLPADLPEGTVVRTPISRALVYSSVHTSLFSELGSLDAVKGVVDSQYFIDSTLVAGIKSGSIADCGNSMNPTVEKVIDMQPDAILLSPYQDASYGQITKLDIPIIECADYLEFDPLGRAEWMKFYGELVGRSVEADSIYNARVTAYNDVKQKAAGAKTRPTVVTEMVISGVWNVPGGQSYMARILNDAGGRYLWADDKNTGSLALDFNQVLAVAHDADFWFIKWTNINSLKDLQGAFDLNKEMAAFKNKRVYVCDTDKTRFFDRIPFHPEVLLREFAAILHPELFPEFQNQMYHHID
ncbi:MAG: ABC transporter substrate-binding protein [Muribaculaceae bacterium]|nr:ABC transporter substrate-binding protein [Muribaculaceae bacterium]